MDFGHFLRTLRISAGIGLRELSRTINVSPTFLSLIENGKHPAPSITRIAQIEEALNVPPGYLLSITHGCNPDMSMFTQEVPEIIDFLTVAKKIRLTSEDFMDLTAFLNIHGWSVFRQALAREARECGGSPTSCNTAQMMGPYIWPFLNESLIFDMPHSKNKESFFQQSVSQISSHCKDLDSKLMLRELLERENLSSTGIGSGVAVPHAIIPELDHMVVAFSRIPNGLDFGSIDGEPVYIALFLAGPRSSENLHLKLLARLAKLLNNRYFAKSVLEAPGPPEIISIFRAAEMSIP